MDKSIEALKLAKEALEADELDMVDDGSGNMVSRKEQAITAIKEVLAEHAMRETQRLGQEIEQEPKIGCVNHDCDECKAQRTEQNFCPRCGKRTKDIHTCTPPQLEQEACKDMEKNAICSPFMISELWRLSK